MADDKEQRIKELDGQIAKLIDEYYQLVSPTEVEIEQATDLLWDDVKAEAECLIDPNATIGKFNLAEEALFIREMEREEKEADNA